VNRKRLSPSALARYEACPRQFRLADLERLARDERPSPQLVVGNAVHHALRLFFGLKPEERSPEVLERALRSIWPEHRTRESFSSREQEADHGRYALELLARFCECFRWDRVALARERWVSARLGNGWELYGKVDRIDESDTDADLEVYDYKTARRPIESLLGDRPAQVYLLGTRALYGRRVKSIEYLYLPAGEAVAWRPDEEEVEIAIESLVQLSDRIDADETFEATPGPACRFCPVAHHCPDADRVELDGIRPVEDLPF
jgi:RecB family exonuclease